MSIPTSILNKLKLIPIPIIPMLTKPSYDYYDIGIYNSSPWKIIQSFLCNLDPSSYDKSELEDIALTFANQIIKDKKELESGLEVSECALFCPAWHSEYDKIYGISILIAKIIFPKKNVNMTDFEHQILINGQYAKLISSLRKTYLKQFDLHKKYRNDFKNVINSNKRNKFNELKNVQISDLIINPQAKLLENRNINNGSIEPLIKYLSDHHIFENILDSDKINSDKIDFEKGTIYSDGRIDLCFQNINTDELRKILQALTYHHEKNGFIQHILLGNNVFDSEGIKLIGEFMNICTHIKTWYLCANGISDTNIHYITDALKKSLTVESLWLKRNPLKPQGIKLIAEMLRYNKSIKILDLSNTGMLDVGTEYLFDSLKHNQTITSLYIGASGITDIGAHHMAKYFETIDKSLGIKNIFIDANRLDDIGTEILCKSLINYPLERLSLGSNRISDIGLKTIFNTMIDSKTLISLDIGTSKSTSRLFELPNNLNDNETMIIVNFLKNNKSVKLLNIRQIGLTKEGLKNLYHQMIENKIENNTTLIKIIFNQAGINTYSNDAYELLKYLDVFTKNRIQTNISNDLYISNDPMIRFIFSQNININT
jgi:hypothetical protein